MKLIKLPKAKNYRDLGGIKTIDGRVVKPCMLLRGTPLLKKHKKDIEILKKEYNLKTVIDLRTKKEAEEKADLETDGITYLNMPILTESKAGVSHERKAHSLKSLKMFSPMEKLYTDMVSDECLENLTNVLKKILLLEENQFSVAFHCSAGKDRTGILSALILTFLGVDRETVMEEYLISNKATKPKALGIYMVLLLIQLNHKFAKKIMMYYFAKESYLESALNSLEKQFGSLDNYFQQALQLSPEETEAIKNKFLYK